MKRTQNDDGKITVVNPYIAENLLHDDLYGLDHEEVWLLYLNPQFNVIGKGMVSKGVLDKTSIDCRTILRQALLNNAYALILLHNHPSGSEYPSQHDIRFTDRLMDACRLMDIKLSDHIILGEDKFFSFNKEQSYKYI